jgi:multisubunit Na+/H+ antiporter MnhG subunit
LHDIAKVVGRSIWILYSEPTLFTTREQILALLFVLVIVPVAALKIAEGHLLRTTRRLAAAG